MPATRPRRPSRARKDTPRLLRSRFEASLLHADRMPRLHRMSRDAARDMLQRLYTMADEHCLPRFDDGVQLTLLGRFEAGLRMSREEHAERQSRRVKFLTKDHR